MSKFLEMMQARLKAAYRDVDVTPIMGGGDPLPMIRFRALSKGEDLDAVREAHKWFDARLAAAGLTGDNAADAKADRGGLEGRLAEDR